MESGEAPGSQTGNGFAATYVGANGELEDRDGSQIDHVVFLFGGGAGRAEVPLLAHDFGARATGGGRPAQSKLLRSPVISFGEKKLDAAQGKGLIENDPDLLFTFFRRAPAGSAWRPEDGFNGVAGVF